MKERILACMLAGALALSLSACGGSDSGEESNAPAGPGGVATDAPAQTPEPAQVENLEPSGQLGNYSVDIHDFELTSDYNGVPAIIVGYTFTNNGEEAQNGMVALSEIAFQNGVQLDTAIISGQELMTDKMKDIKTGASIDLKSAFLLTSETAPVDFEISEFMSLSDAKLGKTFQIAEGGTTILSAASAGSVSGDLGDYNVSVVSHKLGEDYQGEKAVIITLGFTNNGSKTDNFMTAVYCKAFQDGVQLESAIVTGDGSGSGESQMRYVKPGAGTDVSVAYLLTSDTSPVELEIEEFMGWSDEKIETSIDVTQ